MNEEISVEYQGKIYTAEYSVIGDELTVYLPDGSTRSTFLTGGLKPETAAATHIKSYAKQNT
ncbi:hypothetical protein [Marinobacterium aestuarii]|uniref:hypothetical protein n=1 Tax=Marinobacterium aestuarii TaxID=1821621 RepID=UPI0012FFD06A|nr:hypothetical protein [Marinobacterium aestuarii]